LFLLYIYFGLVFLVNPPRGKMLVLWAIVPTN